MKKHFPTFIDETAQLFEQIYVSAGVKGTQLIIAPDDLLIIIKGSYADLI
jgi:Cys-tRNA(Pro)/Cys-tRNA(Cys) deacylase